MDNSTDNAPRHGFSIASLLLLTAVAAIGLAAMQTVQMEVEKLDRTRPQRYFWAPPEPSPYDRRVEEITLRAIAGGLVGLLAGAWVGATPAQLALGLLWAVPIGILWGALAGAVLTDPGTVLVALIGSVLLVLFGAVVRKLSHRPE